MIYLAPLRGYTEFAFRNAYYKHFTGIDAAISPFISLVEGKKVKFTHLKDILPENNNGMPLVPQVMGTDTDQFIVMAKNLYDLGYEHINWNIACPVRAVARKGRGSGILPHPEVLEGILEKVIPCIPNRLSVKTRLGYYESDEFSKVIPVLNKFPLEKIYIHPRTGIQMYEGPMHLDFFSACYMEIKHKMVFSGDIIDKESFIRIKQQFPGISGWMIGRGIFSNLFLPAQLKTSQDTFENKEDTFRAFHETLLLILRNTKSADKYVLNKMKEYWYYFREMFANGSLLFDEIKLAGDLDYYLLKVGEFLKKERLQV